MFLVIRIAFFVGFLFFLRLDSIQAESLSLLEIRFLDVGYGEAIVLVLPEGGAVLIDGGKPERGSQVVSTLQGMKIDRLDVLLVSHFHPDHAGGLGPVLDQLLPFPFREGRKEMILLPLFPKAVEPEVEPILRKIERRPHRVVRRGEIISLSDSVRLETLHPGALRGNPNEDSLVVKVIHGEMIFLFMADIGPEVQRELLAIYGPKLKANVAKIPHHGGESIEPFVQAIRPERAILSVGPNPYGLPKEEVLEMYRRTGARLHRTDLEGTITITSDGRSVRVRTERPR